MKKPGWQARFWARSRPNGECMEWAGRVDRDGYGRMGHGVLVHRQAWAIVNGPIPPGAYVLHRCDNPSCINPVHLFLGDHAANMADKAQKGRVRNGWTGKLPRDERASFEPVRRLTEASDIPLMAGLRAEGLTQDQIGIVFGVGQPTVSRILRGESQYAKAARS